MLTTLIALALTVIFAYVAVEIGLDLAGSSRVGRGVVLAMALLTGFILPWAVLDGLAGLVRDEA